MEMSRREREGVYCTLPRKVVTFVVRVYMHDDIKETWCGQCYEHAIPEWESGLRIKKGVHIGFLPWRKREMAKTLLHTPIYVGDASELLEWDFGILFGTRETWKTDK